MHSEERLVQAVVSARAMPLTTLLLAGVVASQREFFAAPQQPAFYAPAQRVVGAGTEPVLALVERFDIDLYSDFSAK